MQINGKYSWLKHLDFMIVDLISIILSFLAAYLFRFRSLDFADNSSWVAFLLIISLLNIMTAMFLNVYSGIFRRPYYQEIVRTLQLSLTNLVLTSMIFYMFKIGAVYSRLVFFGTFGLFFFVSNILKYIWKKLIVTKTIVLYQTKTVPLLVVSTEKQILDTIADVESGDFKLYDIRAVYLTDCKKDQVRPNLPVIHEDFVQYALQNNINDVLIAANPAYIAPDAYSRLIANDISIHIGIESAIGFRAEEQIVANIGVCRTLSMGRFTFTPRQMVYLAVKRVVDILCGLIGVVLLIPISMFVKAAYLISGDHARIFYTQDRIGLNGRNIKIFKFRTMVPHADELLEDLLKDDAIRKEWEENQKLENDPRITKVGRMLRRASIDEVPQLINVLKGDMSLVGPRPLIEGEIESHEGLKLYQRVKPGITGWWACNGRANINYKERLELEYYYVKHCSFYLDVLCLFRTAFAVMKRDGAE